MVSRLKPKHLPHRVIVATLDGEGAEGVVKGDPVTIPAYVEDKQKLVVDRRSTADTFNQEITASTFVIILPDVEVMPGDEVTVWLGKGRRERTAQVVSSSLFDYRKNVPNHQELWLT